MYPMYIKCTEVHSTPQSNSRASPARGQVQMFVNSVDVCIACELPRIPIWNLNLILNIVNVAYVQNGLSPCSHLDRMTHSLVPQSTEFGTLKPEKIGSRLVIESAV